MSGSGSPPMRGGGLVDLRPGGTDHDPELRRLLLGRAAKLERLGLAEQVGSGRWALTMALLSRCSAGWSHAGCTTSSRDRPMRSSRASMGRTHHPGFSDLEMTGDAKPGAIVEARV
jgi:hypothetical protein